MFKDMVTSGGKQNMTCTKDNWTDALPVGSKGWGWFQHLKLGKIKIDEGRRKILLDRLFDHGAIEYMPKIDRSPRRMFEEWMILVQDHMAAHGITNSINIDATAEPHLAWWCKRVQRGDSGEKQYEPKMHTKLQDMGFVWMDWKKNWYQTFEKLKAHYEIYLRSSISRYWKCILTRVVQTVRRPWNWLNLHGTTAYCIVRKGIIILSKSIKMSKVILHTKNTRTDIRKKNRGERKFLTRSTFSLFVAGIVLKYTTLWYGFLLWRIDNDI